MEHCQTCNLQYKRNNIYNHELTNIHLAADNQYYCQQCERILNLADKKDSMYNQMNIKIVKECGIVRHVKGYKY